MIITLRRSKIATLTKSSNPWYLEKRSGRIWLLETARCVVISNNSSEVVGAMAGDMTYEGVIVCGVGAGLCERGGRGYCIQ